MKIEERSYGGKVFRPSPILFSDQDEGILSVIFPWGAQNESFKSSIENFQQRITSIGSDPEKTLINVKARAKEQQEVILYDAIIGLNSDLLRMNSEDLQCGVELFVMKRYGLRYYWATVGAPFVGLFHNEQLLPLHHPVDLSFEHSQEESLPPLPKRLVGVQAFLNIYSGSFTKKKADSLLLLARSFVPAEVFHLSSFNEAKFSKTLAEDDVNQPFWLGHVQLD